MDGRRWGNRLEDGVVEELGLVRHGALQHVLVEEEVEEACAAGNEVAHNDVLAVW